MKPNHLTATETVKAIKSGDLRVIDVAEAIIARYEERDAEVRAWAFFDKEYIRAQARALDAAEIKGPLHGVAVGIKDVFNTRDMPTQHNSPRYFGSRPGVDAAAVDILRAAGALLVGKAVTTEFAATNRGSVTRNPLDLNRTPGGSSSGSGAVVADFQATIALGTQTGGSTIRPASFTGVFGMKPTWHSISREGFKNSSMTSDTVGLFTRSAADLALLADIFEFDEPEAALPQSLVGRRIAFSRMPAWPQGSADTHRVMEQAVRALRDAGAIVSDVELPKGFDRLADAKKKIGAREGFSSFLNEYKTTPTLHDSFKARFTHRNRFTTSEIREAYRLADSCRAAFEDMMADYDIVLAPSATGEAPLSIEDTGSSRFNEIWSLMHVPVVNVPAYSGSNGLPVGFSLVGRVYDDRKVIAFAELISAVVR